MSDNNDDSAVIMPEPDLTSESESESDGESDNASKGLLAFPNISMSRHVEINTELEDFSDAERLYIPLPMSLTSLRTELLGNYKCSQSPPTSAPIHQTLTTSQMLSLKHYMAWKQSNGTVAAFSAHAAVLKDALVVISYLYTIVANWQHS